jgi:hypothetical protein
MLLKHVAKLVAKHVAKQQEALCADQQEALRADQQEARSMLRTTLLRNVVRNRRHEVPSADQQEARSMLRTTLLRNVVRNRRRETPTADRQPPTTSWRFASTNVTPSGRETIKNEKSFKIFFDCYTPRRGGNIMSLQADVFF